MPLTREAIEECVRVLEAICAEPGELAQVDLELRNRLMIAAGRVSRPERDAQKVLSRAVLRKKKREVTDADRAVLARAGIRKKRLEPVFITPDPLALEAAGGGIFELGAAADTNALSASVTAPASVEEELPPLHVPR